MILYNTVSLDSGTPEQCAMVRAEMERTLGCASDPLDILIALEGSEDAYDYICAFAAVQR